MMEELDKRERAVGRERSQEEAARAKLKACTQGRGGMGWGPFCGGAMHGLSWGKQRLPPVGACDPTHARQWWQQEGRLTAFAAGGQPRSIGGAARPRAPLCPALVYPLQAEIERLRKQAAEREAKLQAEQRQAAASAAAAAAAAAATAPAAGTTPGGGVAPDMQEKLGRTLKVSWNRKVRGHSRRVGNCLARGLAPSACLSWWQPRQRSPVAGGAQLAMAP